jgi:hypothetical protein
MLSKNCLDDRPWAKVGPDDGTAPVIWNDGSAALYRQTRNGGAPWSDPDRIPDHGGSSHLSVGPRGEVAVRISSGSNSNQAWI